MKITKYYYDDYLATGSTFIGLVAWFVWYFYFYIPSITPKTFWERLSFYIFAFVVLVWATTAKAHLTKKEVIG